MYPLSRRNRKSAIDRRQLSSHQVQNLPYVLIQNRDTPSESEKFLVVVTNTKEWTLEFMPYSQRTLTDLNEKGIRTLQQHLLSLSSRRTLLSACTLALKSRYAFQHTHAYVIQSIINHCLQLCADFRSLRTKRTALIDNPTCVTLPVTHFIEFCNLIGIERSSCIIPIGYGGNMETMYAYPDVGEYHNSSAVRIEPLIPIDNTSYVDTVEEIIYPLRDPIMEPGQEFDVAYDTILPEEQREIALQVAYDQLSGKTALHLKAILEADPIDDVLIDWIRVEVLHIQKEYLPNFPNMDAARRQMFIDSEAEIKDSFQEVGMSEESINQIFDPRFDAGEEQEATDAIQMLWNALE